MEENYYTPDLEPRKISLGDKIFGAHTNPTRENDYLENFDLDRDHKFMEGTTNDEDTLHRKRLEEAVFSAFQSSRWYPLSYKKKIPKDLVPHLFQDVLEQMQGTEFGFSEKFVVICDFISIPYSKAYDLVPARYKELIVNELEIKFGVLTKRRIKRLF
jgi:hypothetical protein